ncbi:MAG: Holliday junction branch migration protein RuvA [Alphaproteobacteria bacterium]|nr:Holliday junction branch migration protein RuvA [Alphaproteobacteria bacterium]
MISYLKGTIEGVGENRIVLDVNGVGYNLICSAKTISIVQNDESIVKLYTVLNIREDSWTLFGFVSEQERFWFNKLNSVQGVGGKVAIAILSALSDDEIYNAFLMEDKNAFTRADGVGAKLATRIISELKDKIVGKIDPLPISTDTTKIQSNVVNDVVSALINLGYEKSDILRAIASMSLEDAPQFEILLKQVLMKLSAGA